MIFMKKKLILMNITFQLLIINFANEKNAV